MLIQKIFVKIDLGIFLSTIETELSCVCVFVYILHCKLFEHRELSIFLQFVLLFVIVFCSLPLYLLSSDASI